MCSSDREPWRPKTRSLALLALAFVACLTLTACDRRGPTTPTPPPEPSIPSNDPPPVSSYSLTGAVLAAAGGTPVTDARVEIVEGVGEGASATTDRDGHYTFSALASGDLVLRVTAPGYLPQTASLTIHGDLIRNFDLAVAPALPEERVSVTGVVSGIGPGGAIVPVAQARVSIESGPNNGLRTTTDGDGRFRFDDLVPGEATLEVTAAGYVDQSRGVTLGDDETVDFTLASLPFATNGRIVDAMTRAGLGNITITGEGGVMTTSDGSGAFQLSVTTGASTPQLFFFNGPGVMERQTHLRVPGADAEISLIPASFDLTAFDQMFRGPLLRRWTFAPPLLVEQRVLQFTDANMAAGTAIADAMSDEEADSLIGDFEWALPQMTGGKFNGFGGLDRQTAAIGTTVPLLNSGVITVAWVKGLTAATGFWGYGRWLNESDGTVVGGLVMLDVDFQRSGSAFLRSLRTHELGHALGYDHVTARPSVMNAAARLEPLPLDLDACAVAFERRPGNRSPDIDGDLVSLNRLRGGARWSPPIR